MPLVGVVCPNGNKKLVEECINCEGNPKCYIKSIRKAIFSTVIKERSRWISCSSIIYCLRKAKWENKIDYYMPLQKLYYLMRGNIIHKILQEQGEEQGSLIETYFEQKVPGTESFLRGQIDLYVNSILYDYKTMESTGLSYLRTGPKEEHVIQTNFYKWLLEKAGYAVDAIKITYLTMSNSFTSGDIVRLPRGKKSENSEFLLSEVPLWNEQMVLDFLVPRFKTIESNAEPPADSSRKWLCDACAFRDKCIASVSENAVKITKVDYDINSF